MILTIRYDSTWEEINPLLRYCQELGVEVHERYGETVRQISLIGDTTKIDPGRILSFDIVDKIHFLQELFLLAGRRNHPLDTVIEVKGSKLGGGSFLMMSGPCSVESEEQIFEIAREVKAGGAGILKGGAYMPRSSPHAFSGLGQEGIRLLCAAGKEVGLPVLTEVMEKAQLPFFDDVDIIQVGTRNMQNYELLRELGQIGKPVLLRRGPGCDMNELLQSAEHIMHCGNSRVILCAAGVRTFETNTMYTLDIGTVIRLKQEYHLPVIVDPSQAAGRKMYVPSLALAAAAAGADGLMVDVHTRPHEALAHAHLALTPNEFRNLLGKVTAVREAAADAHDF